MSTKVFLVAILCVGTTIATAQNSSFAGSDESSVSAQENSLAPAPPKYCNPCIFYSGDFNPSRSPNGLLDGRFPGNVDGEVWVPFAVENKIVVTGLLINELFSTPPPAKVSALWGIRAGVSSGNGGQVQCHGTGTANATPTGREFKFENVTYREYTYLLKLPQSQYCTLSNPAPSPLRDEILPPSKGQCPPNCFMAVVPVDPTGGSFGYLSDAPSTNAAHHYGLRNVNNDSFFNSTSYGFDFLPATTACTIGSPVSISKVGCHMFSVGLLGTGK